MEENEKAVIPVLEPMQVGEDRRRVRWKSILHTGFHRNDARF